MLLLPFPHLAHSFRKCLSRITPSFFSRPPLLSTQNPSLSYILKSFLFLSLYSPLFLHLHYLILILLPPPGNFQIVGWRENVEKSKTSSLHDKNFKRLNSFVMSLEDNLEFYSCLRKTCKLSLKVNEGIFLNSYSSQFLSNSC